MATGLVAAVAGMLALGGLDTDAGHCRKRRKDKKRTPLSCSGDPCDSTGGKRCGGRDDCRCYRTPNGGNVCASSLQSSLEETCTANRDCRKGYVGVEGGPACGGSGLRFCTQACY